MTYKLTGGRSKSQLNRKLIQNGTKWTDGATTQTVQLRPSVWNSLADYLHDPAHTQLGVLSVSYKDILVCTQLGTLIERTRYIVTTRYTNSHIQLQYTDEEHMFTVTSARCLVAVATRAPSGFIICLRSRDFHRKNHRTTNDSSPTNSCTCIAITIKQVNYAVELQGDHKTNTKPPIYRIKICQRSNIIRKIQLLQKHGSILYYKLSLIFYTLLNMRHQ